MMSAVMMLAWLGLPEASRRFDRALLRVYSEGRVRTGDLGGTATTKEFTDAVIAGL
jgi:isocitrate dehydrogenase (NAD+)